MISSQVLNRFVHCIMLTGASFLAIQALDAQTPQTTDYLHINAPYVPSPEKVVEAMLNLAEVKSGDVVYDLGCGDGRFVVQAAAKFGARGVGIDLNPERVAEARQNAQKAGVSDKTNFIENDIFKEDFHEASVVTLYLLPDMNARLEPKLLKELKPGSRVVSHSFTFPNWKAEKQMVVNGSTIYLWRVPAK